MLVFDYLKNNTLYLPDFLQQTVYYIYQKDIFNFLKESENVNMLFPEFLGMKPKEIVKKTKFILFPINPRTHEPKKTLVVFTDKREENIFRRNMHRIIPDAYLHYFE